MLYLTPSPWFADRAPAANSTAPLKPVAYVVSMGPPESHPESDLDLALRISNVAAELGLDFFRSGVDTTLKADGSPVTEADPAVETLLVKAIQQARPHDAVIGEELGASGTASRRWILDPIDGTSCFARNDPNWRIHVVLEIDGEIDVAVITEPARQRQWWAERNAGAFASSWPSRADARRLHVSTTAVIEDAVLDARKPIERDRLPPIGQRPARIPSAWCSGLIDLIHGEVDAFFVDGCQLWDHAPWVLLVQEAGGRFTNHHGGMSPQRGGLYSNAAIHDQLRSMISSGEV